MRHVVKIFLNFFLGYSNNLVASHPINFLGKMVEPSNNQPKLRTEQYNFTLHTQNIQALGTNFKVVYADEGSVSNPVIVCVHGAPATHKAFRYLVAGLTKKGYRVILPNLPGMGLTSLDPDGIYNHTTHHKAVVIRELLASMNIKSVTAAVGHSMGGHVVCQLAADSTLEGSIRSICLLSSAGYRPHRLFSPYWLYSTIGILIYYAIKIPLIGSIVRRLVSSIVSAAGLRGLTQESQVFSWYEGSQLHFSDFIKNVTRLEKLEIPALCIYSGNDSFVETPILEDTIRRLGVHVENIMKYDLEGHTMQNFKDGITKRAICFESGTHMVQKDYPDQIVTEMLAFFDTVLHVQ